MPLLHLNTNTNSSYWWLVTSSWIQKSTLKSKIAPSLKRMIVDYKDKSQVMGKPANALLIDCRSMEGRFVNQSTFFVIVVFVISVILLKSCHLSIFVIWLSLLSYFVMNHTCVQTGPIVWSWSVCADHKLKRQAPTYWQWVSVCLIQCDRYEHSGCLKKLHLVV